jgi:hypothetical protein
VLTIALLAVLARHGSEGAALAYSLAAAITGIAWLIMARALLTRAQAAVAATDEPHRTVKAIARS